MNVRALRADPLLIPLLAYCAASLFHFTHNAVFIDEYPNLPASLSATRVWLAWFAITSIGAAGYMMWHSRVRLIGLAVISLYAALGFDGLAHYAVAPMSAHTPAMNLTIWLEVFAAAALLIAVAYRLIQYRRPVQR